MSADQLISTSATCKLLDVCSKTLIEQRYKTQGLLIPVRLGRAYKWRLSDVLNIIKWGQTK